MDISAALHALGVREDTLTAAEKTSLDENGYLPLPGILTPAEVQAFLERVQVLEEEEGAEAGKEVHQEAGTVRLADLVNKDPLFDVCWTHLKVLAAVAHVLQGDLKLSSLNARAALPGHGLQALHTDGAPTHPCCSANAYRQPPAVFRLQLHLATERFHPRERCHSAGTRFTEAGPRSAPGSGRPPSPTSARNSGVGPGGQRRYLQLPYLAWGHCQPYRPTPPRVSFLFLPGALCRSNWTSERIYDRRQKRALVKHSGSCWMCDGV